MAGACSRTDRPLPERYDHPGSVAQLDACLAVLDLWLDAVQRARPDTVCGGGPRLPGRPGRPADGVVSGRR